jgi:glycosyltransferase involved in cell wall biosynthesis
MMYTRICLMIPTFKRVDNLKRCIDSALDTMRGINTVVFCFCVNVNDTDTRAFLESYDRIKGIFEIVDEDTMQPNLSLYYNTMYDQMSYKDAIVTEIGDDMVFKTPDWDSQILQEINDSKGLAIVYCEDAYIAHEKCCVNLFVTRKLVALTKKPFMCSFFHADMIDVIWTMVGMMTGFLRFRSDITIWHNHITREHKMDVTYSRLQPIQMEARKNSGYALAYATIVARNIIEAGFGTWNVLQ